MSPGRALMVVLFVAAGCNDGSSHLPPLGEVVLWVDTDAAVPRLIGRLRVDAYTPDGTWYASRDFGLEDRSLWPTSFGVYSADPGKGGTATIRLRAYADGNVRDYLGERYQTRPAGGDPGGVVPTPAPPDGYSPRLLSANGSDVTPATEPEPLLAIDQLVRVVVSRDVVQGAHATLRGACFGSMADLARGRTCVDTEDALVDVELAPLDTSLARPPTAVEGTFGRPVACTGSPRGAHAAPDGTPLYDEEVCVDGGTFVFGSYPDLSPERIVTVSPFLLDRYEVTVARWRDALRRGMATTATPLSNDGPLPTAAIYASELDTPFCTFSKSPLLREDYPVSCVSWDDARAFCLFEGGDLPSEVQWEWVVTSSGRGAKTAYPWGGTDVQTFPCDRGDFARGYVGEGVAGQCKTSGLGPGTVHDADHPLGDRSVGLGIVDLGFNVSEWLLDAYADLDTRCWLEQPLAASSCQDASSRFRSVRGGSWILDGYYAAFSERRSAPRDANSTGVGFRCARRASP